MLTNRAKIAASAGINKALVSSPSWVKRTPVIPVESQQHTASHVSVHSLIQPYIQSPPTSTSSSAPIKSNVSYSEPPAFRGGGRLVKQPMPPASISDNGSGIDSSNNITVAQYVANRMNGATTVVSIDRIRQQQQQQRVQPQYSEVANIPMNSLVRNDHPPEIQELFKLFQKNYNIRMQLLDNTSEAFGAFSRVINNKARNSRVKCKTINIKNSEGKDEEVMSFLVNPEGSATKSARLPSSRKVGGRATIGTAKKPEQRPSKHVGVWAKCHELFWGTHSSTFHDIPGRTSEDLPQNQRSEYISTCHGTGCVHGNYVHQQWSTIMNYLRAGRGITISQYLIDFPNKRIDPCVIRLMKILDAMECIPWRSEFPIFDEFAYLGTMIDLICWRVPIHRGHHKNQCSVYLELKTGYDFGPFKTELPTDKDMLNLPLWKDKPIKDTPYHRASLQMLVTLLILQQRYGFIPDVPGIIQLSSRKGLADFFAMPDWSFDSKIRKHIYTILSLTMPKICFDRINKGAKIQDYDTIGTASNLNWSYDYKIPSSTPQPPIDGFENRPIIAMEELNKPPPSEEEEEPTRDDEQFIDDDEDDGDDGDECESDGYEDEGEEEEEDEEDDAVEEYEDVDEDYDYG